jgi:hypothetical protein
VKTVSAGQVSAFAFIEKIYIAIIILFICEQHKCCRLVEVLLVVVVVVGERIMGNLWDKEHKRLLLQGEVQKILKERQRVEQNIRFYLDASGHLLVYGTDYFVQNKNDAASVRAYVLTRRPRNVEDMDSYYRDLTDELERRIACRREVSHLQDKSRCLTACLQHLSC